MKHLKIIGLCLVAVFAMGMTTAAGASAAPVWEQCAEGASGTKYSEHECLKAEAAGKWAWQEVKGTEKVLARGTLRLSDSKTLIGKVEVSCAYTFRGTVGPGKFDRIETVEIASCAAGKSCEKLTKNAEPINLPWQTELSEETEHLVRDKLTSGGKGAPGWKVTCKVSGLEATDECTSETGAATIESRIFNEAEDAVVANFGPKYGKAKCSVGGAEAGEIAGSLTVTKESGAGLRAGPVTAPTPASVEQVNFLNNIEVLVDHQNNKTGEKAIKLEEYGEKNNAEWVANKKNWPLAYVKDSKIRLTARFALSAATRKFLKEEIEPLSTVPVIGEMFVGGSMLTFKRTLAVKEIEEQLAEPGHENYIEMKEVESVGALPNEVRAFEIGARNGAVIYWNWTVKKKKVAFEQALGFSNQNLYLTLATAVQQKREGVEKAVPVYLTVLDLDTQGIEKTATAQPPSETEAISGVWSEFDTRNLGIRWYEISTGTIHRGGFPLEYYEEIPLGKNPKEVAEEGFSCTVTGAAGLLENEKGQCHAWSELFSFALADEGLSSVTQEIFAELSEPAEKCNEARHCWFLVNNWKFNPPEKEPPFPFPYKQVEDLEGLEGQGGIKNPTSVFIKHFLVEAKKGSEKLYDPSYGSEPVAGAKRLKEYQEKYIAGFCTASLELCQKAPAGQEIDFSEFETYG
jgi:hypothetical protein